MSKVQVFVPSLEAFNKAEKLREDERKQEKEKLIREDIQYISNCIKNFPPVIHSIPQNFPGFDNNKNVTQTIFRPAHAMNNGFTPVWLIEFPKGVCPEAMEYVINVYSKTDFVFDYAMFNKHGEHEPQNVERSCTIWKRSSK